MDIQGGLAAGYFESMDTAHVTVTAINRDSQPVLIEQHYGDGTFYISSTPICFLNYYLLSRGQS